MLVKLPDIQRNQATHPSTAMHDVRRPAQLHHGFHHALVKEDHALVVVAEKRAIIVAEHIFAVEVVLIVQEIYLHAHVWEGGHFNEQGRIVVAHGDVDA